MSKITAERNAEKTWDENHQRAVLEAHGMLKYDFGCDSIDHICDALEEARNARDGAIYSLGLRDGDVSRLEQQRDALLTALREWNDLAEHSGISTSAHRYRTRKLLSGCWSMVEATNSRRDYRTILDCAKAVCAKCADGIPVTAQHGSNWSHGEAHCIASGIRTKFPAAFEVGQ